MIDTNTLKNYLFGTPDRVLSFVSVFIGIISTILTVFLWQFPEKVPTLIIIRDIAILFLLLLTSSILLSKYIRREQQLVSTVTNLEKSNQRLLKQFEYFHLSVHKFRSDLFCLYRGCAKEYFSVSTKERTTFERICHSITSDLKSIYSEFLLSHGIDIKGDLCVSVKLMVSREELTVIFHEIPGPEKRKIGKKKKWVYTAYRDPETFERFRDRREVAQKFYSIEGNTGFDHIYSSKNDIYSSDDLKALGAKYKNENPDWNKYYNATLLAPIRYYNSVNGDYFCFGFIAIDSMNSKKEKIFEIEEARHIIGQCADLLATFFLLLNVSKFEKPTLGESQ